MKVTNVVEEIQGSHQNWKIIWKEWKETTLYSGDLLLTLGMSKQQWRDQGRLGFHRNRS